MKKAVSHVWERLVAFICVLTLTASYLPAMPVFGESKNGYSTEISADESEADVGETITFNASIKFNPEDSTDEEKEDFSFDWYVNDDHKADGDTYELKVDSLDGDSEEYEVYFEAKGKTSGNTLKSDKKTVTFYKLYTVSFEGADVDSVKKRSGQKIELPKPSKDGNRFTGWKDSDKTYDAGDEYTVNGDATLTAQWQETVKITFDADGGKLDDDTITIDKETGISESDLPNTTKDHYKFLGWFKDEARKTKYDGSSFDKDSKLYAGWEQTEFKVTFDANGGNGGPGEIWVAKGKTVPKASLDNKPTYEGHDFKAWKLGNKTYTNQKITKDTVLTADWNIQSYKITFDANGGKVNGKSSDEQTKDYGSTFGNQLPKPTREDKVEDGGSKKTGYKFSKWVSKSDSSKELKADTEITGPWDVEAEWKETDYYKVTYVCEEGEAKGSLPEDQTTEWTEKGKKASCPKPSINNAEGADVHYAFEGWYTDEARTNKYNEAIEDAATLYAHWTKLYKVSFVTSGDEKDPVYVQDGEHLKEADAKKDLTKEGYKVVGFFKDKDYSPESEYKFDTAADSEKITASFELYVKWEAQKYKVVFDKNAEDAEGTMEDQDRIYDDGMNAESPVKLRKNAFSRKGYTFTGWNTAANGSGTSYVDETTENLTAEENAEVKLYAQWKAHGYGVRFHSNYTAEGDSQEKTVDQNGFVYDTAANLQSGVFTRDGYTHYIWSKSSDGTGTCYVDGELVINLTDADNGVVDLYAIWIDEQEPTIEYKASLRYTEKKDENSDKDNVDFSNSKVVYTITIQDNGSGVDTDNVYYATAAPGTDKKTITDWIGPVTLKEVELEEDGNKINAYQFEVNTSAKGAVFVKAQDKAQKEVLEETKRKIGDQEFQSVAGVKDDPNIGYAEIHLIVLEKEKPDIKVTDVSTEAEKDHSFKYEVTDLPEDKFSGLAKVTYTLQKDDGNGNYSNVANYSDVILVDNTDHTPEKLEDIDQFQKADGSKKITGKGDEANGLPTLNGNYRLTVTAVDFCGNKAKSEPVDMKFDNTAPHIALEMDNGIQNSFDEIWYYNASDDENLTITFGGTDADADTAALDEVTIKLNDTEYSAELKDNKATIPVKAIKEKYGDGKIKITVHVSDTAGNETNIIDDPKTGKNEVALDANGVNRSDDRSSASFVLDSTAPEIVLNMTGGNQYDDMWYYNGDNCNDGSIIIGDEKDAAPLESYSITPAVGEADKNQLVDSADNNETKSVTVAMSEISKLEDGKIIVSAQAKDRAGNETTVLTINDSQVKIEEKDGDLIKSVSFVLDKSAPALSVKMSGGKEFNDSNKFYYRADNCGLTLNIGSSGDTTSIYDYKVRIKNTDNGNTVSQELIAGTDTNKSANNKQIRKIPSQKDVENEGTSAVETIEVAFSAEEMQKLGDGHLEVTAVVRDYALNENKSFKDAEGNEAISGLKNADNNAEKATCVLDMTNPVVTEITTSGTAKGRNVDGTANAAPYDEEGLGSFYYYNDKSVDTTFVVQDVNLNAWTVSYKKDGTAITQDPVKAKNPDDVVTSGTENKTVELVAKYFDESKQKASSEGRYTDISVAGQDKAGNPLVLAADYSYTGKTSNEVDPAGQTANGSGNDQKGVITLKNGKVIDYTAPVATLTYDTKATAYLYNGTNAANQDPETVANNYSIATAYINKAFKASVAISDTYDQGVSAVGLDFDKLTVRQYGKNPVKLTSDDAYQKDGTVNYAFDIATDKEHATDGAYFYKIFGTDRAGNAMTVKEAVSDSVKTERIELEKLYETEKCESTYHAKLRFILDTVNPTFAFALADPKGDETTDGNTAYYGSETKSLSGTFSVVDTHIDTDRIGVGYGSFSASDVSKSKKPHYSDMSVGWDKINIEHDLSNGGKGSTFKKVITRDKEGIYRFGISGVDKAGNQVVQSSGEAKKTGYKSTVQVEKGKNGKFWTWHKVLDKTAPTGDLKIGDYYHVSMDSHGNNTLDTKNYNPYRSEKKANVSITSKDLSPIRITYDIDSTVSGQNQKHADKDYANNNKKSTSVNGEQIFHVSDLLLIDRAGNKTGFYKKGKTEANKIYLDKTPPKNYDVDRPQATITASSRVTASSPDGRDLFNRSIDLTVHVVDPFENVKSSGLKFVNYEVKADGKTVISKKHDGVTSKADLYKDVKLEHEFKETVNIPKGGTFETNDIEITVTAEDNAGNVADVVTYKFGIDTVGPEIVVTYNNNSAQNGFYFKENRIATVEVTERNVDDDKIKIDTQVGKSAFRNVRHSGNGNNDKWQKTLSYTVDGNYTLNISGTDALGNPAKVSYSNSVAPQKFTIDKTAPGVNITYDNNDVLNEKYYKATRTATISISDVNFAGQNDIRVESRGGGSAPATVSFSGNTATIHFSEDGIYVFNGTVTDQAGNVTTIPVQTEFVIDTKVPVLTFDDGHPFKVNKASQADLDAGKSDHPVDKQFFTKDGFAPVVTVTDTNISTADQDAVFNITGTKEGNTHTRTVTVHPDDGTKYDMSMASTLFKVVEDVDDVYNVVAYAIDLAGNKSEEITFTFSINRFGSNFVCATEETKKYIRDKYYHNATEDLEIHEYNTNAIKKDSQTVEVMKDGNTANVRKLVAGKDYDFEEDRAAGSKVGGRIYKYTIHKDVFEEEGDYSFTISSVDEAGHENTTARIHRDTDQTTGEKKLSVASFPIDFVIDKTPPTNQMTGVKSDRKQAFNDRSLVVDVNPEDAQTGVSKVVIRRWETDTLGFREPDGEPMADITYAYYDEENPMPSSYKDEKTGTEHSFADLSEYTDDATGKIDIDYELTDNQNWQWVEVITTDLADNDSVDIRAGSADSPQIVENRKGFLVTTNTLTQVINNTAARVGAGAGVAALLILLILWKRKKDKDAEGAM